MSNVVPLRKPKKVAEIDVNTDINSLVNAIVEWADVRGIDVYENAAFSIRVADLMAQLQIMARETRQTA